MSQSEPISQETDSRGRSESQPAAYAKTKDPSTFEFSQNITISQDHTHVSQSEEEKLSVLQHDKFSLEKNLEQEISRPQRPAESDHALQDYQMQLMLLEQQNKKRLMMARAEQDTATHKNPQGASSAKVRPAKGATHQDNMQNVGADGETPGIQTQHGLLNMEELQKRISDLRCLRDSLSSTTWQVFHIIVGQEEEEEEDVIHLARPSWTVSLEGEVHLVGKSPIADAATFLHQRPEIAFAVYRYYRNDHQSDDVKIAQARGIVLPDPVPVSETIHLIHNRMIRAMNAFRWIHSPDFDSNFPGWRSTLPMQPPFLFWYRFRNSPVINTIPSPHREQMQLLTGWIDYHYQQTYAEAEEMFSHRKVSKSTMPFFVRPGDILVKRDSKGLSGYIADSWAEKVPVNPSESSSLEANQKASETWQVAAWSYIFDGRFDRSKCNLSIRLELDEDDQEVNMANLDVVPLRFCGDDVRDQLARRGRTMWSCRHRRLITYNDALEEDAPDGGDRYMVDFNTYKKLHPFTASLHKNASSGSGEGGVINSAAMEKDEPPTESDLYVLPGTLVGYSLRQKKWTDLEVDKVQEVIWNKQAFEHLVVDHDVKDIIQALVSSKLESEQSTDLIQGKGNGLIILLHGTPGTGKTFTAESVAEIAEKPLYRVTCGDIGTKPEQVEKYLESVLHLGKIWGCVVLLDEADVFLEQRTLTDLERNALVSVFLRVIEYYEGILILTSNRVGTFDEAFKSRILLSLHYKPLTRDQRRTIWENFLRRLRTTEDSKARSKNVAFGRHQDKATEARPINFDDINKHLGDLAKLEMNGRQIRNAITTARQLARFKDESMSFRHLEHVIDIAQRFDKYLKNEQTSFNDTQMAWGQGF